MLPLEDWEVEESTEFNKPDDSIRSIIGFSGAMEGGMVIKPCSELFTTIAANMLGVERPDKDQKIGALCEITNIICGNTVPLFAKDDDICYIHPPRIADHKEDPNEIFQGMNKESLQIFLDEGIVKIDVYYSTGEEV